MERPREGDRGGEEGRGSMSLSRSSTPSVDILERQVPKAHLHSQTQLGKQFPQITLCFSVSSKLFQYLITNDDDELPTTKIQIVLQLETS